MGLVSVFLDEWVNTHVCTSSCRIHACVCATLQVQTHTYTCICLNDDVGKFLMRARDLGMKTYGVTASSYGKLYVCHRRYMRDSDMLLSLSLCVCASINVYLNTYNASSSSQMSMMPVS